MGSDVTFIQQRVYDCDYQSEISNQFMLTVFSKSVVLRTEVSLNKSEVIAL